MKRTPRPQTTIDAPIDNRAFDLLSGTLAMVLALHAPHLPWWLSGALALILGWRWWQRMTTAPSFASSISSPMASARATS